MQQFIDKLISRLEEEKQQIDANEGFIELGIKWGYKQAIEIVNQLAEEYKGGWIPCSERLPDVANSYLVTKMCENDGNPICETAHEIFWTNDGKWDCERDEYCDWKVTAWRETLSPYQKEGK